MEPDPTDPMSPIDWQTSEQNPLRELDGRLSQLRFRLQTEFADMTSFRTEARETLGRIEGKLDAHDERLAAIEGKLDAGEERLVSIEGKLDGQDGRLAAIEGTLRAVLDRLG